MTVAIIGLIGSVLGLGGTAYMWWANRKAAANSPVMKANAIAQRDLEQRSEIAKTVQAADTQGFERQLEL